MGKVKNRTHKATKKRLKIKSSKKGLRLEHNHQNDNDHLKTNKSNRQLNRQEGKSALGSKKEAKKLAQLVL